jgi:hypothetical protein
MRYYTQLVFVRPGREEAFQEFEDHTHRADTRTLKRALYGENAIAPADCTCTPQRTAPVRSVRL